MIQLWLLDIVFIIECGVVHKFEDVVQYLLNVCLMVFVI
jgi:hypothetical protein